MNILFLGDVNGKVGRTMVRSNLNKLILDNNIDFTIANVENAAAGFGITPPITEEFLSWGIDLLTTGNHIWDKKEIMPYLESQPRLLRPVNYPPGLKGYGWGTAQTRSGETVVVVNLMGRVFMPPVDCPFQAIDRLLPELQKHSKIIIVDMHAEASSEKQAMGVHVDGRVSAVVGTHTHVQTADERVLPGGTGYITDCGFAGAIDSVIGVIKEQALLRFLTSMPTKFESATGRGTVQGVVIELSSETGRCAAIRRVRIDEPA
ncbi:MAG: TIGR00282 family metallophosphoesterase [Acidobacteria bacterium]|nr:TIGR00282 family metallophosphoesterase [Acidobacteriota bacterium]